MRKARTSASFPNERLKRERLLRGWTQADVAGFLDTDGYTVNRWERGRAYPSAPFRRKLCELFHKDALDLGIMPLLLKDLERAPEPVPGMLPVLWSIPHLRNPCFTGREELLHTLHTRLSVSQQIALTQPHALHGLGGVGKTQLALEYAYRYASQYQAIFWIEAETIEHILSSLLRIAEVLQLPERKEADQQRVTAAIRRWLSAQSGWLLIWDNLEDLEHLQRFPPPAARGATLITTRCQALGPFVQGVDLAPMEQEEGLFFVLRRAKRLGLEATSEQVQVLATKLPAEYVAAGKLVRTMGGLPLALDQMGAYLEETGCSFSDYFQRYEQQRAPLLDRRGHPGGVHPLSVTATMRLANQRVAQQHPAAANLLRLCAFLSAEGIPEELFVRKTSSSEAPGNGDIKDLYQLDQVVAVLRNFSLIQRHPETRTISLHRLVQAVLQDEMSEQEREAWQWRAIRTLNSAFPEIIPENWLQCERFLPHMLTCTAAISDDVPGPDLAEILRKTADYLRGRARFTQAEPLYRRALHIEEHLWGSDHLRMAAPLYGQALLYYELGKYVQAESLARRALHIWERALSPEDPELARPLIGLAIILFAQGKYVQTELLCQRSLHLKEQALGQEHPHVLPPLVDLADAYTEQGKYAQAELLYQRAIRIQEQTLGEDHPQMAYPLYGLGRLYTRQGKNEQAETLYQRALCVRERTLGMEHPYVAEPLTGLAIIASRQGKDEQAEALYRQALSIGELTWGPNHPELTSPLLNLAELYTRQGKDEQAEVLYQRVLWTWEQEVGMEHPSLVIALSNLATLSLKQGKKQEAQRLSQRALCVQESCTHK